MITLNLGTVSSGNVHPNSAYGILRSPLLPADALCLAVQGLALGILFGNPLLGCVAGAISSLTDRVFAPFINQSFPGNSTNVMGVPLGLKNATLAGASIATAILIARVVAKALLF
jgi:hypothetical protein